MLNFILNSFTLPLDNDYSWVQLLTGMHWLVASIIALTIRWNKHWFWILFSSFLFYCAIDEAYMVHECFKYSSIGTNHSIVKDWAILFYGMCSLWGAWYFYKKFIMKLEQKLALILMLLLVVVVVGNDVFDLSTFTLNNSAEECVELILSAVVIYFVITFPESIIDKKFNLFIMTLIIVLFIITGLALRTIIWTKICPSVLSF